MPVATEVSQPSQEKPEPIAPKTSAADWIATNDDDEYFYGEKRERGGRKKRKKKKEVVEVVQDWDDIYDPSRPNNYEEYKHSEEKIREVRDWKDLLYRHRMKRRDSSYESDQSERPMNRKHTHRGYGMYSHSQDALRHHLCLHRLCPLHHLLTSTTTLLHLHLATQTMPLMTHTRYRHHQQMYQMTLLVTMHMLAE